EEHAAIGARETAAALSAVGDHLADSQLPGERFALRFEINARGETLELVAAGVRSAKLRDHRGEVASRLYRLRSLGGIGLRLVGVRVRLRKRRLALGINQLRDGDARKRRIGSRNHWLGGRTGFRRSNNSRGKRRNHQQR